jgi:hypothetical protein
VLNRRSLASLVLEILLTATPAIAQPASIPAWRLTREMSVSSSSEGLSKVNTMVVTPTGTVAVVDGADMKISIYDSTGRRIARTGGRGAGPGELGWINEDVHGFIGDSVWFFDGAGLRIVVYTSRGKHVRTTAITERSARIAGSADTLRAMVPLALTSGGRMIVRGSLATSAQAYAAGNAATGVGVLSHSGMLSKLLGRIDAFSGSVRGTTGKSQSSFVVPFIFSPQTAAASDGAFVLFVTAARGGDRVDTVRVTVVRSRGDTAYSVQQVLPRTRMPDSAYEKAKESQLLGARRQGLESQVREPFIRMLPHSYPAVDYRSFVTREGRTWLRLHPKKCEQSWPSVCEGSTNYLVISPTGTLEAMVAVPASLRLVDAFGDRAWGLDEDGDGFMNIVRFRLRR